MRVIACALIALNVALIHAAPQNGVVVESDVTEVEIARSKGDERDLFAAFQNDEAMVKTCLNGVSCEFMTVGEAKALERQAVDSVEAVKGETEMVKALTPSMATMSESLQSLQAQKTLLEQLEASMALLRSSSAKGQELAEAANNQFAASMSKGIQFSPETKGLYAPPPDTKGLYAPPAYAAKGPVAMPPSKGARYPSMSNEAILCPMTMFELGKCQKYTGEMKVQMDQANALSAQLLAEKQRLENQLSVSEMLRQKAEEQAAFNAKYANEQKTLAESLAAGLNQCTAEKAIVKTQKETVEAILAQTQVDLSDEREENDRLTSELKQCNEDKAALNASLAEQTARAEKAEEDLAATKARLEEETDRVISLQETLGFTENRLSRCESDLKQERTVREETEEELMKTMTDLTSCQNENKVTQAALTRTQQELQERTAALARETAARIMLQDKLDATVEELRGVEKELRETKRALEDEQNAHTTTRRILAETKEELEATEAALKSLEEAKQIVEDTLVQTQADLEETTAERDELQVSLNATTAALEQCTTDKAICEANFGQLTAYAEGLNKQLTDAIMQLNAEKLAREQLTATIISVQETSLKVQEEITKLQTENILLQKQVEKLQAEQGIALALAAGCPPTYEKFGSSCYKYVREKTQWKMAQEQCMKDRGNLVAIESTQEQVFVTNYLKRLDASDAYTYTSGNKQYNGWKWLGAENNHIGASGVEFWYNLATKQKAGYDCQAMYMYDPTQYGKWVGLPCHSSAPYVCEFQLIPYGQQAPSNPAEQIAILEMAQDAPPYLSALVRQ